MNFLLVPFMLLLCAVMVYLFFFVQGRFVAKVLGTVLILYIASSVYFSFNSYRGWPVWYNEGVTTNGALIVNVMMTGDGKDDRSAIFVTAIPCVKSDDCFSQEEMISPDSSFFTRYLSPWRVFGYSPARRITPRIFEFPYTDETRKIFAEAQEQMEEGARVFLKQGKGKKGKVGTEGDEKEGSSNGSSGRDNTKGGYIEGMPDFSVEIKKPFDGVTKQ